MSQLPLPLRLADQAVFESFWPGGNAALVAYLARLVSGGDGPGCWIFGPAASGKTHLLQAVCARAGERAVYLPLELFADSGAGILDGLATRAFVCIDGIDRAAGNAAWEHGLFELCNQLADRGGALLAASRAPVRRTGIALPDLESRLAQLASFQLKPLRDDELVEALKLRCRHRGLDLPPETARYLLHRNRRDMASLYRLLDRLDEAALCAQRRLTIPFVKSVLPD